LGIGNWELGIGDEVGWGGDKIAKRKIITLLATPKNFYTTTPNLILTGGFPLLGDSNWGCTELLLD
jgi:hypothetical protein